MRSPGIPRHYHHKIIKNIVLRELIIPVKPKEPEEPATATEEKTEEEPKKEEETKEENSESTDEEKTEKKEEEKTEKKEEEKPKEKKKKKEKSKIPDEGIFTGKELEALEKKIGEVERWRDEKVAVQEAQPSSQMPKLTVSLIKSKVKQT